MAAITAKERAAVTALLADRNVDAAYAMLRRFPDLKQADLPALDRTVLAALADDVEAVRAVVAGLYSANATLRRMSRKYAPKLGDAGPRLVAHALIESIQPLRSGPGLAGNFGGFASPLGRTLAEEKPSWVIPPNGVYSPGSRLVREVFETAVAALSSGPVSWTLLVFERVTATARPFARVPRSPDAPENPADPAHPSHWAAGAIREPLLETIIALAKKADPEFVDAAGKWARCELLADAVADLRLTGLPPEELQISRAMLQASVADFMRLLPVEVSMRLYWTVQEHDPKCGPAVEGLRRYVLADFARAYPREAATRPESRRVETPSTEGPPAPLLDPVAGPSREDLLDALTRFAEATRLPAAWDRLAQTLGEDFFSNEERPAADPQTAWLEPLVDRAIDWIEREKKADPNRAKLLRAIGGPVLDDNGPFVPEARLDAAPWADDVGEAISKLENSRTRLGLGLRLLPARLVEKHAARLVEGLAPIDDRFRWPLIRRLQIATVARMTLRPVLAPCTLELNRDQPHLQEEWQFFVSALYRDGAEGRAAATEAVRAMGLPRADSMYRRHLANRPWHWAFQQAWQRRDAAFLGAVFERLAVPMCFKGARALVPAASTLAFDRTAPYEGSPAPGAELPVADVFAFLEEHAPGAMRRCVENASKCAGFEKSAATLLALAAATPSLAGTLQQCVASLVDLLEAPKDTTQKAGLEVLAAAPALVADALEPVLRGVSRCVASSSPGVTQAAAELLGTLGSTYPAQRAACTEQLEELLFHDNVPTVAEAMKALKALAGKKAAASLSARAARRVKALGDKEPKKLGKLAAALGA